MNFYLIEIIISSESKMKIICNKLLSKIFIKVYLIENK